MFYLVRYAARCPYPNPNCPRGGGVDPNPKLLGHLSAKNLDILNIFYGFEHILRGRGGVDSNPKLLRHFLLLKVGHYKLPFSALFNLKTKFLISVQENRGPGVKAILAMSKYEQIFFWL